MGNTIGDGAVSGQTLSIDPWSGSFINITHDVTYWGGGGTVISSLFLSIHLLPSSLFLSVQTNGSRGAWTLAPRLPGGGRG